MSSSGNPGDPSSYLNPKSEARNPKFETISKFKIINHKLMHEINEENLRAFIFEASRATYASADKSLRQKQPDGSTSIQYENGLYKYHDNYFGGEPYGGREVVFFENKPVWMMVYYGFVYPEVEKEVVYSILTEALSSSSVEVPYRGPYLYEKGDLRYENKLSGDVKKFSGKEKIFENNICLYEADYMGGLVDQ